MTVAWATQGTVGVGSTSVSAGPPSGWVTGDGILMQIVAKPTAATVVTPTGWTVLGEIIGGGGTTGNGTGPTKLVYLWREKDATWTTMPAVSVTSGDSVAAIASRYTKDAAKAWEVFATGGAVYGTAAATTNGGVTFDSNPGITAGDVLVVGYSNQDEAPTWSAQGLTAPGATIGSVTERSEAVEGTTGSDVGGMYFTAVCSAGEATGPATAAATLSAAGRGTAMLVRLRDRAVTDLRSSSKLIYGGGRTTTSVPVPAGAAINDIAVVGIWTSDPGAGVVTPPTGFTLKYEHPYDATNQRLLVYWKRLTAADSGTWNFTHASLETRAVAGLWLGRVTTGDPFGATSNEATPPPFQASHVIPEVTATAGDALVSVVSGVFASPWSAYGLNKTQDTMDGMAMGYIQNLSAGATGSKEWRLSQSTYAHPWMGTLTSAGGGGAPVARTLNVQVSNPAVRRSYTY